MHDYAVNYVNGNWAKGNFSTVSIFDISFKE